MPGCSVTFINDDGERESQQAANADCSGWELEGVVTIPKDREVKVGQMGI